MRMTFYKLYTNARGSLWLVPVVCVIIGAIFSFTTLRFDHLHGYKLISPELVGGPDAAMGILTTVATSMVSLTALVLTIVLVVVQLAMGQFSPRIVQRLLRDRPSQFAIGLFVATFVHTLMTISDVKLAGPDDPGQVPGLAVLTTYVLSLTSVAVLVMYVHHVGQALRVSALVELAGGQTRQLLDKVYPDRGPAGPDATDPQLITAKKSGVVTTIAYARLVNAAREGSCVIELVPALGEYVAAGAPLFRIEGSPDLVDRRRVLTGVILQLERTLDHDVAYGLRLLVDMAERSLSDSRWQDPTTAVQAIDRLHDCLRQLAPRPFPDGRHYDEAGELRFVEKTMSWEAYVDLAFTEIRLAGAGSPQVARRLRAALEDLCSVAPDDRKGPLRAQLELLEQATEAAFDAAADTATARQADPGGLSARVGVTG